MTLFPVHLLRFSAQKCSWKCFNINNFFSFLPPTSNHPLQVENCDSNSRLVVDEYYNGEIRLDMAEAKENEKESM